MSFTISEHHVLKYDEDVMTAYQQEGSRLTSCVEEKMNIIGKSFSVNRLGVVEAVTKTTRHELHQHQNPEHSVRWANMVYYYNSVLMDPDDDDRVLANPKNKYVMTAAMSLGRRKDQTIIDAGLGTAITGENRAGTQALPTAQIVTGSTSGFTMTKWRTAKRILDENEVPDSDRYTAISAQGLEDLLADTTVTSADFNTVKALVNGDLNTFLGLYDQAPSTVAHRHSLRLWSGRRCAGISRQSLPAMPGTTTALRFGVICTTLGNATRRWTSARSGVGMRAWSR